MRIVVVGAGGTVGGWISELFSHTPGIEQVGCVRKWASAVRLARRGIPLTQVDLAHNDLTELVRGADVVVNAAMLPPAQEPKLVESLYRACNESRVRRYIQLSSAAVYGHAAGEVDESVPPSPCDSYSFGKAEMELRLLGAAAGAFTQVFILRPSIVYGPFSAAWTERYARRILAGRWKNLGPGGEGFCNLVHGRDLARVVLAAATGNAPAGNHVLNVNGPDVITWNQYIERLGDQLQIPGRKPLSGSAYRTKAFAASILRLGKKFRWVRKLRQRSRGAALTAILSAQQMTDVYPDEGERALLCRRVHYSAARLRQVLGVEPSIRSADGINESAAWCKRHGIV